MAFNCGEFRSTKLDHLFKLLKNKKLTVEGKYNGSGFMEQFYHEAGYDAYMTAVVFHYLSTKADCCVEN